MKFVPATLRKWMLGVVCLWLAGSWAAGDDKNVPMGEYQIKAAFLYNFTRFTDWPASAFASATSSIVIGIVGDDPFGQTIDQVTRGEKVGTRSLVVKRLRAQDVSLDCHVLFISRSEVERMRELLSRLKEKPVLTVSDNSGFAELGGMVNFALINKTVKLEINQAVVEASGLQISSKLLKLARMVKSK